MVKGSDLIDPSKLYNLLNQLHLGKPSVADDCYMILFDARKLNEFNNDHVITSRHISYDDEKGYQLIPNLDYSIFRHIVVIDSRTSSLKEVSSPANVCANLLWEAGSKYPVKIVNGGYEEFTALYPFLRVNTVLFTKQEIYNLRIYPIAIDRYLYIGTFNQASDKMVTKNLKIKAHVNVSKNKDTCFDDTNQVGGKDNTIVNQLLWIPIDDDIKEDIYSHFATACSFIEQHNTSDGKSVLVYSDNGASRSVAIVLAYLISKKKLYLSDALKKICACHFNICPNRHFIESLLKWEKDVHGDIKSSKTDLGFFSYD